MQNNNIKNILAQAANPKRFPVMAKKFVNRFADRKGTLNQAENSAWLESNITDIESFAANIDKPLWSEAVKASKEIERLACSKLESLPFQLGGGGAYPLLYFLTRLKKPQVIVETGVAAGFSSASFFSAVEKNGSGVLYSSDFPYFRIAEPEKYIGIIVDDKYKSSWSLYLDGDQKNLPKIIEKAGVIDLFHYDSDKSYSGRALAMNLVGPVLSQEALIIMDDIHDNSFFYDYISKNCPESWYVFKFENKYVGLVGSL